MADGLWIAVQQRGTQGAQGLLGFSDQNKVRMVFEIGLRVIGGI